MKISTVTVVMGLLVWVVVPWWFSVNPNEPAIFQWGLCLKRDVNTCIASIYWLDFFLLGGGLVGLGLWRRRRQQRLLAAGDV